MSWTRTKQIGSGVFGLRVSIEGSPYDAVTSRDMEAAPSGSTRGRYVGLKTDGIKLSEEIDLSRGIWKATAQRITLADVNGRWTELFTKRPTLVTYLTLDVDDESEPTLTVLSTAGWPDDGILHVDRETMHFDAKLSSTTFGIDSRGLWDTLNCHHYKGDGENLRFPEVTDWPVLWQGRRVRLYAYGAGDDPQGDGSLIWIGVLARSPNYNGVSWSFTVDPLISIFDAELGGDLKDPCPIRGIYYPASAPLLVTISQLNVDSIGDTTPPIATEATVTFAVAGFWETNNDFCASLTTRIAAQLTAAGGFTQDVAAVPYGDSWEIQFTTASANPRIMQAVVHSAVDHIETRNPLRASTRISIGVAAVAASTAYILPQADPTLGTVPRATYGIYARTLGPASALPDANKYDVDGATNPQFRIYLGGGTSVTANTTAIAAEWASSGFDAPAAGGAGSAPFEVAVIATDATNRYVTTHPPILFLQESDSPYYAACRSMPQIKQGRSYGRGNLEDILQTITDDAVEFLNLGATPDIRSTDIDFVGNEIPEAAALVGSAAEFAVTSFAPISLGELVRGMCLATGVYPCSNTSGLITFRRQRLPGPAEATSKTITGSSVKTDEMWLAYEREPLGVFNTVVLRTGYNPVTDEFEGTTWKWRDVAAFGQAPNTRSLVLEPKLIGALTVEQSKQIATRLLGMFGGPYAMLTVDLPLTHWSTLLGDVVSITWTKVPAGDGTLGVDERIGIVVSREWEPRGARGRFTIFVTDQRVGGYVPAAKISSIDSGASGGTGPFVVTVDTATYLEANATAFWEVGDKIRVYKWNDATPSIVTGTLTAVGAQTLTFTTDAAWTHAGATWAIGSQVSTSITAAGQKVHVYVAKSDGLLDFSGDTDNPPFTFA